jgi:hypothetical protein
MKTSSFLAVRRRPTFSDFAKPKCLNIKSGEFLGLLGSYSQMPKLVHARFLSLCDELILWFLMPAVIISG